MSKTESPEKDTREGKALADGSHGLGWLALLGAWSWSRLMRSTGLVVFYVLVVLLALYLGGMIFYNGPFQQAGVGNLILTLVWLALGVFFYKRVRTWKQKLLSLVVTVSLVVIPYSSIKPSNNKNWSPEYAMTGYSEIRGDAVTLHQLRNFDYGLHGEVTERWETRTVHLSNLQGLEVFHDAFLGDFMGHPILSFDFGPDGRVCLSVETRRELGEEFTPFGGLYKMFELQYLFSTEEDCIRLRTNVRKEPVFLYEVDATAEKIKEMFLASVRIQNELAESPKFYNVIFANCTTSLRAQRPEAEREPWDHRVLFNGLLDEWLYERGMLKTYGMNFQQLRKRCKINTAAQGAHNDPAFSTRIRAFRQH
ncbi:MAG: DUF4105 domain-containing protein [Verrucomicrobiae bacterium]|nr:DUF4105 domain-containing protein [Verrucomicrobiae bacterium]